VSHPPQAKADGDLSRKKFKVVQFKLRISELVLKLFGVHGLRTAEKFLGYGCQILDH